MKLSRRSTVRTMVVSLHINGVVTQVYHLTSTGQSVTCSSLGLSEIPLDIASVDFDNKQQFIFFFPKQFRGWIEQSPAPTLVFGPKHHEMQDDETAVLVWTDSIKIKATILHVRSNIRLRLSVLLLAGTMLLTFSLTMMGLLWVR